MHTAECFAGHMGLWALRVPWMRGALAMVRSGRAAWPMRAGFGEEPAPPKPPPPYAVHDGVALLGISGPTMKALPKFGGTSTVALRKNIRTALADDAVTALMLKIDSPGGHVSGTKELADDVRAADAKKPVHAFIEDMGASAAYWVGSQASRLTANALAEVGSIGVYGVLYDESQAAEMEGVKVHVISSGPLKGAGAPGTPVTPEMLADYQTMVDAISAEFFSAVKKGRGLSPSKMDAATTGGTWIAATALSMGLLDAVETEQDAIQAAAKAGRERSRRNAAASRARDGR